MSRLGCFSLVVVLLTVGIQGAPVQTDADVVKFLTDYGYLKEDNSVYGNYIADLQDALREFQKMMHINETGEVDEDTLTVMNKPRCGCPDIVDNTGKRRKRFSVHSSFWTKKDLTYAISAPTNDLTQAAMESAFKAAFDFWANVTSLTFRKETGSADITIIFAIRDHGDGYPFDGPGKVLAHAFVPSSGGDLHLDDDETWTLTSAGTNLMQVAVHEIGHSIGLLHSNIPDAVMFPTYQYKANFSLHADDIAGAQSLYPTTATSTTSSTTTTSATPSTTTTSATPSTTTTSATPSTTTTSATPSTTTTSATPSTTTTSTTLSTTSTSPPPNWCDNKPPDAVVETMDGSVYWFRDDHYALIAPHIASGYPRPIQNDWPGLPGSIDAAFTWADVGITVFFKGSKFWYFMNRRYVLGPVEISSFFSGVPNDIEAVLFWPFNNQTYVFKDNKYYRLACANRVKIDPGYPRMRTMWRGLPFPRKIHAATAVRFSGKRRTYFFFADKYYRYEDEDVDISSSYPKVNNVNWLGCPPPPPDPIRVKRQIGFDSDGITAKNPLDNSTADFEYVDFLTGPNPLDVPISGPGDL